MYNVRVFHYVGGDQIRVYEKPFDSSGEVLHYDPSTGEIFDRLPADSDAVEVIENPFSGLKEKVTDLDRQSVLDSRKKEESKRVSMTRTKQMIYSYSRSNKWDLFITMTFNPDKVDSFDYDCVVKKLSKWLNNLRRSCPDVKYLVVPEKHKSGRWHFHGLFANVDGLRLVDSGKRSKGQVIYNVGNYKLGFTTATKVRDSQKVSNYICKYISKELCDVTFGRRRYWVSRNLNREEGEEMLLTASDRSDFLRQVQDYVTYRRTVEGAYNTVTYLELSCNFKMPGSDPPRP